MTAQRRRRHRPLALALALVLLGGVAVAYFTAGGDGAGSARAGTSATVTLSPAAPGDSLVPGATVALAVTATNPGSPTVRLPSLAVDRSVGVQGVQVDGAHAGCDAGSLVVALPDATNDGSGWVVPAGVHELALGEAATLDLTADDACQGATFSVALEVP